MIIIFYLPILAVFAALFALGYFPAALLGRLLTKRRPVEHTDAWAPVAGVLGIAIGFLFSGLTGFDRFALAPDHVRMTWQNSGSAFVYELWQVPLSGAVSALALFVIARRWPRLAQNQRLTNGLVALVISFINFSFWPVFLSPFL
jgi:hypothetical protein